MTVANANLSLQVRRTLYTLKRAYGVPVAICKLMSLMTDSRTGVRAQAREVYGVERAVVLPERFDRALPPVPHQGGLTAGSYDARVRDIIIDRRDAPDLSTLGPNDWVAYNRKKYQIKSVEAWEVDAGWVLTVKVLDGQEMEDLPATATEALALVETVVGVL